MKATTPDEKFIVTLYQLALEAQDLELSFNRYEVGDKIALQIRGVNAICKLLLQANFIKKSGEEEVYLTKNGVDLAIELLEK
jgi:predicted transcriptional regulator